MGAHPPRPEEVATTWASEGPVVIGSGFGGAVAACRLAQAGLSPTLLERGRAYGPDDFPQVDLDQPDLSRWSWRLDKGLWDIHNLRGLHVVQAAGLGGGSLIYANVHLRPPAEAFESWPEPLRRPELDAYFDLAAYMMEVQLPQGSHDQPELKSRTFEEVARRAERGDQVFATPLAVRFGGEKGRPNVQGTPLNPCVGCGRCDTGCPERAKNTLDLNYLAAARSAGARILTQHEVERLSRTEDGWRIEGFDHLQNQAFHVLTPAVFLCAGALGTTELLLRSRAQMGVELPMLGRGFFSNVDALGMVYDTKDTWAATQGPTITRGLLDAPKGHGGAPWLLVQEGGWPQSLAPLFGLFRSELLAGLNRRTVGSEQDALDPGASNRLLLNAIDAVLTLPVSPGLAPAVASARRTEGLLEGPSPDDGDDGFKALDEVLGEPASGWRLPLAYLPPQAQANLHQTIDNLTDRLGRLAGQVADQALAKAIQGGWIGRYLGVEGLKKLLACFGFDLAAATEGTVVRDAIISQARNDLGPAVFGQTPGDRAAMFLAMGRDGSAQTLTINADDRVEASEVAPPDREVQAEAERVLRDLADATGGELRVNPAWVSQRVPITVHAQGGVALGRELTSDGELKDAPGVFVLDAAAFPEPVGANPSATIAAVAERNIEAFIRRTAPDWSAPETEAARAWAESVGPDVLDPLTALATPTPSTGPGPFQLSFNERLAGFWSPNAAKAHVKAEQLGVEEGRRLLLELRVETPDLEAILAREETALSVEGRLEWTESAGSSLSRERVTGTLELFGDSAERELRYVLASDSGDIRLNGRKVLHDDPGFDAWEDATSVFVDFELYGRSGSGIIRVSFADFFGHQLPSMRIEAEGSTVDPGIASWGLGAFGAFFFGRLIEIYSKGLIRRGTISRASGEEV